MSDPSDQLGYAAFLAMIPVGLLQMALDPGRAKRGWYSGHCSCTRVPDAMNPTCAVHGKHA